MNEQAPSPIQSAVKPGLIIGLVTLVLTYLAYFIDSALLTAWYYGLVIMVLFFGLIIYLNRHIPNRREAHVFHIVQLIHQTPQLPPMPIIHRPPIQRDFLHPSHDIVRRIAIRKTIRSHQINHIGGIESLSLRRISLAGEQGIFDRMQ